MVKITKTRHRKKNLYHEESHLSKPYYSIVQPRSDISDFAEMVWFEQVSKKSKKATIETTKTKTVLRGTLVGHFRLEYLLFC